MASAAIALFETANRPKQVEPEPDMREQAMSAEKSVANPLGDFRDEGTPRR